MKTKNEEYDPATKIDIQFYTDSKEALVKALAD